MIVTGGRLIMLSLSHKLLRLVVVLALALDGTACANIILGGSANTLTTFNEVALKNGQGAVLLHVLNRGSLVATRWVKLDDPKKQYNFTVYQSSRHRSFDRQEDYDVVEVTPGTYALYSVFGDCDEGLRPIATDFDIAWQDKVVSSLGQVSVLKSYKSSGGTGGAGIWGGSGSGVGLGANFGMDLIPGEPVTICNLRTEGVKNGQAMLATVTVKAGELVYAGELELAYSADAKCDNLGNWMTDNQTSQYCGADWVSLEVKDRFITRAFPFIEKKMGGEAASRALVRLAKSGSFVSVRY